MMQQISVLVMEPGRGMAETWLLDTEQTNAGFRAGILCQELRSAERKQDW